MQQRPCPLQKFIDLTVVLLISIIPPSIKAGNFMIKILAMFLLVIVAPQLAAIQRMTDEQLAVAKAFSEMNEEQQEFFLAFVELDWKGAGTYKLPRSHSTLSLPERYLLFLEDDAKQFLSLCNDSNDENIEAIMFDEHFNPIYFESYEQGYVPLDALREFDPSQFIAATLDATEKSNIEQRKSGGIESYFVKWIQEPILDMDTHTIFYILEKAHEVNSVAIKFSSIGFEKITWISDKTSYVPSRNPFDLILHTHSFDPGFHYEDY